MLKRLGDCPLDQSGQMGRGEANSDNDPDE